MNTDPAGLTEVDQAEITALIGHMDQICASHGKPLQRLGPEFLRLSTFLGYALP